MKINAVKRIFDAECEKKFSAEMRGYTACCSAMRHMVETLRGSSRLMSVYTKVRNGVVTPHVAFMYGHQLPEAVQKVCPFCGDTHTVEIIDTVVGQDEDFYDFD